MTLIAGLIITAFILFFFEIFVPGGVLAVLGGIMLLAASALAYTELGFIPAVIILIGGLLGAIGMFFLEIRFISRTPFGRQLSLQSSITATLNPKDEDKLAGMEGATLTILAPSGKVEINGKTYTASAQDGYLDKGVPVRVVRSETFKLIVERK